MSAPPPPPQPVPENQELSAAQQTVLRNEIVNLKRLAPRFVLGEHSWDIYMDRYLLEVSDYNLLTNMDIKKVLYSKLSGEAYEMASPQFNPTNDTYKEMNVKEYAKALGNLFEPASESGQAKLMFEQRVQIAGEHPTVYFQHKLGLFMKAYKTEHRDFDHFYSKFIIGLINQEMRDYLRLMIPEDLTNTQKFREKIITVATMVRRKYLDGEINESDALGAEAFAIPSQYANKIGTSLGKKNSTIHAISGMKPRVCYHCRSKEHFIAQCPRKAAGLPAAIQSLKRDKETYNSFIPTEKKDKKKGSNMLQQKGKTGKMMFVFEDENGDLQCEELEEDPSKVDEETDHENPDDEALGVNFIAENEELGFTESDFIHGSFVGFTE